MNLKANEALKRIPAVAVTVFAINGDTRMIRKAGCDDYIAKPIVVPIFLETMEKHLS